MLQLITKEQIALLQVVTDPKGMFQPQCGGAESVSSSLPWLSVAPSFSSASTSGAPTTGAGEILRGIG